MTEIGDTQVPGPKEFERPNVVQGPVVQRTSLWASLGAVVGLLVSLAIEHPEVWTQIDTANPTVAAVARFMPLVLSVLGGYIGSKQGATEAAKRVTPVDDPSTYSSDLGRLERLVPYSDLLRAVEQARRWPTSHPPVEQPLPRRQPGETWEDVPPFGRRDQ